MGVRTRSAEVGWIRRRLLLMWARRAIRLGRLRTLAQRSLMAPGM